VPESIAVQYLDTALAAGETPVAAYRQALKAGHDTLARRFEAGEPVERLVAARALLVDALLERAWMRFVPEGTHAALAAVGGYGRGELHPGSDIDLMVLTGDGTDRAIDEAIGAFVTFLWDIGLEVGHSVRTLDTCVEEAASDLTVITNIMEGRLVAGDGALLEAMHSATAPDRIWPSDAFFRAKWEEQRRRHGRYEDTAYRLEPNIKGSPGGLRDIQTIWWVAKRHFGADSLHELVDQRFLTEQELRELTDGQYHLWRIRFALHLLTGRSEDQLLFDHQRALATQFGFEDDGASLAVEKFMQSYYRTVMELNRLNEMLMQHFRESILLHDQLPEPEPINRRFQARGGFIEVKDPQVFVRYPLALLEIFLLLQQHPELEGVRASTIRLIRAHTHLIDQRLRNSLAARSLFMEIFRQPTGLTHALRRMNRYGVLAAYLPAFARIVGRMQYDLYHIYTVDEHTLVLIRNLRRLAVPEHREEFPRLSALIQTLPKPELLYLAGLFHDIAKGRGGDHSELGAVDALEFCTQHGLSDYDAQRVSRLVGQHLLMSMTAQRKDIDDPAVIQDFAEKVRDRVHLDYLYLLTVADIRATNPDRWNAWKSALLHQLYTRTRQALSRGLDNPQAQHEVLDDKKEEALRLLESRTSDIQAVTALWATLSDDYFLHSTPDEIAWQTGTVLDAEPAELPLILIRPNRIRGGTEIFVCTPDRDNLFAVSTQVIDQLCLNVMDARIETAGSGCTMNSFLVLEDDGSPIDDDGRMAEIRHAMREGLRNIQDIRQQVTRRTPRQLKHFETPTEIRIDADPAHERTIMHLRTTDRPGLLSLVGYAFAECGVRVISAKISTIGEQVEDLFFVTDRHSGGMLMPDAEDCLARAIRQRIESAA
jgi:[protein-PII] uridylyltransferase